MWRNTTLNAGKRPLLYISLNQAPWDLYRRLHFPSLATSSFSCGSQNLFYLVSLSPSNFSFSFNVHFVIQFMFTPQYNLYVWLGHKTITNQSINLDNELSYMQISLYLCWIILNTDYCETLHLHKVQVGIGVGFSFIPVSCISHFTF